MVTIARGARMAKEIYDQNIHVCEDVAKEVTI
jgi:hypothetical protein